MFDLKKIKESFSRLLSINGERQWLLPTVVAVIFILIVLVCFNALLIFETSYLNKFYPGSRIGSINLSGLTKDQAFKILDGWAQQVSRQDIQVKYPKDSREEVILLDQVSNPDSASDYLDYDVYQTVYNSFNVGRGGSWPKRLFDQFLLWRGYLPQQAVLKLNKLYIKKLITSQLEDLEVKMVEAAPQIICKNNNCQVEIMAEKEGVSFNYDEALADWEGDLKVFENKPIQLKQITVKPQITKQQAETLISKLNEFILSSSSPQFYYQDSHWAISKTELAKIISFEQGKNQIYLSVNRDNFFTWFKDNIGQAIDIPAQNATIKIVDGKITSLLAHRNGQAADVEKAYLDFKTKVINQDFKQINLAINVKTTTPEVTTESINNLGIKEILGVGESNFAGSPTNRIKNIKNGASKLQGLLIKPGEEFSLIKTLLPVDASTGYFPELVIKGNKTMPEYGGGLCQIGTTVFRAALASGLPILERQNHSYSVTYYLEKGVPGVDATIYDPKPDLRFKNDTGNYILIQSRIVGTKLYFEFWGTKDGRTASRTTPKTWGVKAPLPPKIIETLDLKPGEKKCTEAAHKGISASFNYIVTYADGHTATTTFTSVYKPWQEVCLVGVEKLTVSGAVVSSTVSALPTN